MWKWLYFNSPTVQAVCAILALVGLAFYAWDTRRIRVATLAQSDASRRPYFELVSEHVIAVDESGQTTSTEVLRLQNSGVGIALDVAWKPLYYGQKGGITRAQPKPLGNAAPGSLQKIVLNGREINRVLIELFKGIALVYTDTAGKQYFTFFLLFSDKGIRVVTLNDSLRLLNRSRNREVREGADQTWYSTVVPL